VGSLVAPHFLEKQEKGCWLNKANKKERGKDDCMGREAA